MKFEKNERGGYIVPQGTNIEVGFEFPDFSEIWAECEIGAGCKIGRGCKIGSDSEIGAGCEFGAGCKIGQESIGEILEAEKNV